MWILSWKTYSLSKMATFISIIGALTRYGGAICLFSGLFLPAAICIAIGIAIHYWAEGIANSKWKSKVRKGGYEAKIRSGDLDSAIQLYKSNPKERTLKYFETLNPQVANRVRAAVKPNGGSNTAKAAPAPQVAKPATAPNTNSAKASPQPTYVQPQPKPAVETKKRCLRCGADVSAHNKFCPDCGNSMEPPKPQKCLRCGEVLEENKRFCGNCGYQVR